MYESFVQFYLAHEYGFAATQLALAMLGMGATLRLHDFIGVVRFPYSFITGMVVQLLGVFVIALLIINGLAVPAGIAIGLAICAAIPGGTTSNIFTHLAHGNTALSVALTTVCSLACLLTTPLMLSLLLSGDLPDGFKMPSAIIARDIFLNLLLPLAIGMMILKYISAIAHAVSVWSIRLSLLTIVGIIVGAAGAGRLDLSVFGAGNILIVVGFMLALLLISSIGPLLVKRSGQDTMATAMEVTVRNINLGLLVHVALFAGGDYPQEVANLAFMVLGLYGLLQMVMCIPMIIVGRRLFKHEII